MIDGGSRLCHLQAIKPDGSKLGEKEMVYERLKLKKVLTSKSLSKFAGKYPYTPVY